MLPQPRHFHRNPTSEVLDRRAAMISRWMPGIGIP
jgi:hypothetical protein